MSVAPFGPASSHLHLWSNGIMPRRAGPDLSWFAAPLAERTPQAWIACIDAALAEGRTLHAPQDVRALMERFRDACVFDPPNLAPRAHPDLLERTGTTRVLLIDEPLPDSLSRSKPGRIRQFTDMVDAVHREHPDSEIWLARNGVRRVGEYLSSHVSLPAKTLRQLDANGSLCASIAYFDHVYTVSAGEGLQALLHGIPLHVFGTPYYAGWGLTHDHVPQPARNTQASLDTLFATVFLRLARHVDPVTRDPGTLDALLATIEAHRAAILRLADFPRLAGIRFQWWKRPYATPYLTAGGASLRWIDKPEQTRKDEHAVVWGGRSATGLPKDTPMIRLEDGFFHSTGLGSDHIAPCSQIIDRRGIYFDATRPSELTAILNTAHFTDAELSRARQLRHDIANLGVTKYNLGRRRPTWSAPRDQRIVLVPGQVADDAAVRLGTQHIATAEDLLHEVRQRCPDAFIVYKPHPDVLSGNRRGLIDAASLANAVDRDSDLISLIEIADEVHTLSSLSGFEALIRGKRVHTYGLPFYSGWGLTHDALEQPWRDRELTLDMLTAGVLLRYPLYWDWSLRLFTTPEAIVRQLASTASRPLEKIEGDRLRLLRKAIRWSRNGLWDLAWQCRKSFELRTQPDTTPQRTFRSVHGK